MQELPINTAGYPDLLRDTGAIGPMVGPFWSLGTMISPVYQVGSSSNQSTYRGLCKVNDFVNTVVANPLAGGILAITPALPRGIYNLQMSWDFNNATAGVFSRMVFQSHNISGGTIKLMHIDLIGNTTIGRSIAMEQMEITEELPEAGGWFDIQVSTQLTASAHRTTMRWRKVGEIPNL